MSQEKLNQGITSFRNGNKKLALQFFSEAVKSEPRNEAAWLWLAACVDSVEQKEFCFNKALEINPNNENAQKALAQIKPAPLPSFEDLTNNPEDAIAKNFVMQATDVAISIQVLKCPMCGGSIKQSERECSYCGSTLIITSIEKTVCHQSDTQLLSTSANKWQAILRTDPNNPEANYALGLNYLNQKIRDIALQYLQKASLLMPDSALVHYNLALTLFNDGNVELDSLDYKNVIKEIDYATRLNPNFKEAQAFKHFFTARKLDDVDYAESIKEYKAAIDICPDIATFHSNLGFAYYNKKNYALAEKNYLKAIEIDPEFSMIYNNLCLLYCTTERWQEGVIYGRKAVELLRPTILDNFQVFAYGNYSMCLWKTNQTDEAIRMIKKAIAINPQEPTLQQYLKMYQGQGVNIGMTFTVVLTILLTLFILFFGFMFIVWISL